MFALRTERLAAARWRAPGCLRRRERGFSLIELMITVAIIGILAAIAIPSYRSYVLRSNRTDAVRALTLDAQILQRCYSQTFTFEGCAGVPAASTSANGYYAVDSETTAAAAGAPATFLLQAMPVGAQVADTTCALFTLDQAGQQLANNVGDTADESTTCWGGN